MKKIVLLLLLLILIIIGINISVSQKTPEKKSVPKKDKVYTYNDVTYNNIIFSDIKYAFNGKLYTFTCNVSSLNEQALSVKSIDIILKNNNEEIGRVIGYVGGVLEYNKPKTIIAESTMDYTKATTIEFEINQ